MIVKSVRSDETLQDKILHAVGRLADPNLSDSTRSNAMKELSFLLSNKPFTVETFTELGVAAKIVDLDENERQLVITVPKRHLPVSLQNQESADVAFTVNKVLNI